MAGECDVSWGIFDENFVEEVETIWFSQDIRGEFGQNERRIPEQKHVNMFQCF